MNISALTLGKGEIAHTLIEEEDGTCYEVQTVHTVTALDQETAAFWSELLKHHPYETTVYKLVPANKPMTNKEAPLFDLAVVNEKYRRDLELGDLYVTRTANEDEAALEHDNVIGEFKSKSILLFTLEERNAIYGPGKMV